MLTELTLKVFKTNYLYLKNPNLRKMVCQDIAASSMIFDSCSSLQELKIRLAPALTDDCIEASWNDLNLCNLHTLTLEGCSQLDSPIIHSSSLRELHLIRSTKKPSIVCPHLWILSIEQLAVEKADWTNLQDILENLGDTCREIRKFTWSPTPSKKAELHLHALIKMPFLEVLELASIPFASLAAIPRVGNCYYSLSLSLSLSLFFSLFFSLSLSLSLRLLLDIT